MSHVYLMKNMDNGYYKIGYSEQPQHRERTLQAQEPDVRLLTTIAGTKQLEQKLRSDFSEHRARGEWFSFSGSALYSIAEVFGVPIEVVDPPSESFKVRYCVAHVHRYAGRRYSTRLYEERSKRFVLEVPYVLAACEAEIWASAVARRSSVSRCWRASRALWLRSDCT